MTRWTDDHKKRALQMRQQGHLFKEIAVYLGCTEKAASHFFASQREALAQMPPPPDAPIVPPRTFVSSMIRETLTGSTWTPNRPGAMDYKAIKSVGI